MILSSHQPKHTTTFNQTTGILQLWGGHRSHRVIGFPKRRDVHWETSSMESQPWLLQAIRPHHFCHCVQAHVEEVLRADRFSLQCSPSWCARELLMAAVCLFIDAHDICHLRVFERFASFVPANAKGRRPTRKELVVQPLSRGQILHARYELAQNSGFVISEASKDTLADIRWD